MINLQAVLLYSLLGKTVFDLWHLAEYNEEQKTEEQVSDFSEELNPSDLEEDDDEEDEDMDIDENEDEDEEMQDEDYDDDDVIDLHDM